MFLTSPALLTDEEGQFRAYTKVLKGARGKPVTIRTSDIGADKSALGDKLPSGDVYKLSPRGEKNPLLGLRGIRLSLKFPAIFKTQVRALLRAGVHGDLRVMFPMISGTDEMAQALALVEECKAELRETGAAFKADVPFGAMIELPSAALAADLLAPHCAFFSIGTNDLLQYTFAVDRENENLSHLVDYRHPAFLRLVKMTVDAAHNAGIHASVCGEVGGDPTMTALLLGLGVDELSMTAGRVGEVKKAVLALSYKDCVRTAVEALRGQQRFALN
jgi:phosphotransferase system enzyme I (PtsI)